MNQLEEELAELKGVMKQFSADMKILTEHIQGLTELTSLILEGAMAEAMEEEAQGVLDNELSPVWSPRASPN